MNLLKSISKNFENFCKIVLFGTVTSSKVFKLIFSGQQLYTFCASSWILDLYYYVFMQTIATFCTSDFKQIV